MTLGVSGCVAAAAEGQQSAGFQCAMAAFNIAITVLTLGEAAPELAVIDRFAAGALGRAAAEEGAGSTLAPLESQAAGAARKADGDLAGCALNSFAKGTPVLLANGKSKPIEKVKVGDKVLATDPTTGETSAEPVTALIRHTHSAQLVRVTVDGRSLVATAKHPFWVDGKGWIYAKDLKVGDRLRGPDGQEVAVVKLKFFTRYGTWFNLTIGRLHTYYVEAGRASSDGQWVLVHNSCRTYQTYTKTNPETGEVYSGRTSGFGTPKGNVARRDASHSYSDEGFGPAIVDKSSSSKAAIRGREQNLIDLYRDQGRAANKINGISSRNQNGPGYLRASKAIFGLPR